MRIQVLRLPLLELGGVSEEPFALIADQVQRDVGAWSEPSLAEFAERIGARAVWVTDQTVEIVEPELPHIVDHVPFDDVTSSAAEEM
ncbi:hypothetical protein ACU635_14270 [[Actinomadura] parvosata]|uniref:hypothetical protein n=1 Tax=[Actinomadura] parvosata TaxID=1955412 RepID=UPI00406C3941